MRILDGIPFEPDPGDVFERLHLDPQGQYAGEVNDLIAVARRCARPRAAYKVARVVERESEAVVIAASRGEFGQIEKSGCAVPFDAPPRARDTPSSDLGAARARFVSRALRVNLGDEERAFAFVVTCGRELDSLAVARDDVFGQFCQDTIKEMALWTAITHLYRHLQEAYGLDTLAAMNPGSGEESVWPIEQQRDLFAFLGDVEESIGVVLTDSCVMVPNKSVSGVFYPSDSGFESCHLCLQARCSQRRAAFDPHLWKKIFG